MVFFNEPQPKGARCGFCSRRFASCRQTSELSKIEFAPEHSGKALVVVSADQNFPRQSKEWKRERMVNEPFRIAIASK